MRIRLFGVAAAICLLVNVLPTQAGGETKTAPAIVVRMRAIEQQMADAEYIGSLYGAPDQAKKFVDGYKAKLKGNSLDGIDVTRPIGAYVSLGADLADSKIVLLLPIADQKAFLDILKDHDVAMEKEKDGLYTMNIPNAAATEMLWDLSVRGPIKAGFKIDIGPLPNPFYVRFAGKYAHIALGKPNKDALNPKRMIAAANLLPANTTTTFSVSLAIDQLPAEHKKHGLAMVDGMVAKLKKEKTPEESAATHALRTAFADEIENWTKSLSEEAGEATVSLDVDRKKNELSMSVSLAGKQGTKLAKAIADLGAARSVSAGLVGKDSAMSMFSHVTLPKGLRKAWDQFVDEELQKEFLKEENKEKRALQEAIFKALRPTLRLAEIDYGMNMRGPSKAGHYAAVVAVKVKDGETVLNTLLANLPKKEAKLIERDVAKFGAIRIHKFNNPEIDDKSKQMFGDGPAYFAARDDALMLALGDGALAALKDALASKPAPSKIMQFEMSVGRAYKLLGPDQEGAQVAAKKAFADHPDADRIRMTIEGGKSLRFSYGMSGPVIAYFQLIGKMKLEDAGK